MRKRRAHWPVVAALAASQAAGETAPPQATHMSEALRSSVSRVVIVPAGGGSREAVTGTYEKKTPGLAGGISQGAEIGQVPVEVGHVPVVIPIPVLRELGMLFGGIRGTAQRHVQAMRDRMTDDLVQTVEQPLTNAALANDVYWGLREASSVDPKLFAVTTPIPQDTDAVLYVTIDQVTLNIQKSEAIITTTATAKLERYSDGSVLYRKEVSYEDRDAMRTWAKDDYALWTEYRVFARHFLGRELAAELYGRIAPDHSLAPASSGSIKAVNENLWQGKTGTRSPTLVWAFELRGDDAGAADAADVLWDIEVYDERRPVYSAKQVRGMQHTVDPPLEPCKTYRWTVRPVYPGPDGSRNGAWMRAAQAGKPPGGLSGRKVSEAHAYIQDFPVLRVDCKAK
ncbi:MAG: hypothetical protein MJA32_13165 [Proteobacteria bacterium]|nr:hypothetical protein [Pseudomonadota bacterium]